MGTIMDRTVDELALEMFQINPEASVAEITRWLEAHHHIDHPDSVRDVIIHYWHLQQEMTDAQSP